MGHAERQLSMSAAEFLRWDEGQTVRHEFVRGAVFAMTGGTDYNLLAAMNIAVALRNHLRGTPCRTLMTDVKLRVDAADCFFYPDVMVTCSAADAAQRLIKREPILVVEVLSPGTAAYDRGDKFADYRLLPSLREYLLVDVKKRRCDLFRKQADGLWVLHPAGRGEVVVLASVELTLTPEMLWDEVPEVDNIDDAAQPAP